jgi:hypothetical protein
MTTRTEQTETSRAPSLELARMAAESLANESGFEGPALRWAITGECVESTICWIVRLSLDGATTSAAA